MDIKAYLCESIADVRDTFIKDLSFVPVDKFAVSPMGVARPPKEYAVECAGFCRYLAMIASGNTDASMSPEQRKAYAAKFNTAEEVSAEIKSSYDALVKTIGSMSDADLEKEVKTPWGEPTSMFKLLMFAVLHTSYHDGQVNYVQALYGDGEMHWE